MWTSANTKKVKHRTLANLSHCSDEEIEAIRIALKGKKQILYGLLTDEQGDTCCHEKETEQFQEKKVMFGRYNQNGTSSYVEDSL